MKKIIFLLLIPVLVITGCAKKLEVKPTQSVDEAFVFTSDANIKAALNGAYDIASGGFVLGGDMQLYSELLGADGEIRWVGTYNQPDEVYNKAILTNNTYIRETWLESYRVINVANNILANINTVAEADRDRVKGEALFLRGLMYFELVKLFGKPFSAGNATTNPGVQIVTVPTKDGQITEANKVPRSTVQQTYDQVLADLTAAKPLLSEDVGVYAGRYAAAAVLSRVYLQMADYTKARDEANDVIENSGAQLTEAYAKAFNNTAPSPEDIFVLPVTPQDGTNDMWLFWSTSTYAARDGDVEIRAKHLNLYEAGDARRALFFDESGTTYSGKWQLQYKYLPLIRLAEMYLNRAEANFRSGTSVGASPLNDITTIRSRAGLTTSAVTLASILAERHKELAHEGQRIHDVKRLKQTVDGFAFDANKLVFPIPLREINAVGPDILKQNEGY